jgi:hypothetical protein
MSDHARPPCYPYVDRATQDRIGRELRVLFAAPLQQPLPDRLLGALSALQDAETPVKRSERPVDRGAVSTWRNTAELAGLVSQLRLSDPGPFLAQYPTKHCGVGRSGGDGGIRTLDTAFDRITV